MTATDDEATPSPQDTINNKMKLPCKFIKKYTRRYPTKFWRKAIGNSTNVFDKKYEVALSARGNDVREAISKITDSLTYMFQLSILLET